MSGPDPSQLGSEWIFWAAVNIVSRGGSPLSPEALGTLCYPRSQLGLWDLPVQDPVGNWEQNALRQGDVSAGSWQTLANTFPAGLKAIFHLCLCFQVIATSIS